MSCVRDRALKRVGTRSTNGASQVSCRSFSRHEGTNSELVFSNREGQSSVHSKTFHKIVTVVNAMKSNIVSYFI